MPEITNDYADGEVKNINAVGADVACTAIRSWPDSRTVPHPTTIQRVCNTLPDFLAIGLKENAKHEG